MTLYTFCNVSTKVHTYFYFTSLTHTFGLGPNCLVAELVEAPYVVGTKKEDEIITLFLLWSIGGSNS